MENNSQAHQSPFDYGLRSRLLLLLVVMLLPFALFSAYLAYSGYNQHLKDRAAENARDAHEIAGNVDELVQSTGDLLVAIAKSEPAKKQDFTELKSWFKSIATSYPYYKNIIFVDLNGDIRAAAYSYSKPDGKVLASVKETAYYKRSINSNGLAYGDFMQGLLSNKPVIHITYPVFVEGKRVGFVAVAFDLSRVQERIVTVNVAHGSEVSVLDQNGTVIARTLDPKRWVGKCFRSDKVIGAAKSEQDITAPGPDGIVRLMSFSATKQAPWMVAVCFEESIIRNQALKDLLKQLGLFAPLFLVALFGWMLIGRDVDVRYKTAKRLGMLDSTTALGSFVKFNQDIEKDIARAKRQMQSLSLILFDIDSFRDFNKAQGYQYGNLALKQIAEIAKGLLRDTDFAYRYGADEIALILTDTDELDALELAEKLQAEIAKNTFAAKSGLPVHLSVSVGIAVYPLDASDGEALVQCAAEALFEAKSQTEDPLITYSQTARPSKVKAG